MKYNDEQADAILRVLQKQLALDDSPSLSLNKIWWILIGMRARSVVGEVRRFANDKVLSGPFAGMKLTPEAIAGYNACILLGSYEHELHATFERIIAGNYKHVLNIGCSVGYYAVGLALRMPNIVVEAYDIDPEARRKCAAMAALNGVQDRVRISGEFRGDDFVRYAEEKTLALVDIEGAELGLLDPTHYPSLRKIDIVVELHDVMNHEISGLITDRFSSTHQTEIIQNQSLFPEIKDPSAPSRFADPFDRLLLAWEGRDGPTPWGVFTTKAA